LLGLLFEPGNGVDMFFPEIRLSPKYKVLQPYSSHNTDLHNLYYSPKIILVVKLRRMRERRCMCYVMGSDILREISAGGWIILIFILDKI
jgi:hypothetical protein